MSNSNIVLRPIPIMSSLFHNDGIKSQINKFLGNELNISYRREMNALLFRKKYFWKIYVDYLSTLKRGYRDAIDKDKFVLMIRKHLDVEVHYNIPIFETAWRDVKILISVGIFVNAFRKEDIMQEIWDVSHKRCLERERVLKENAVRMKHLPQKAKRNYKRKRHYIRY